MVKNNYISGHWTPDSALVSLNFYQSVKETHSLFDKLPLTESNYFTYVVFSGQT